MKRSAGGIFQFALFNFHFALLFYRQPSTIDDPPLSTDKPPAAGTSLRYALCSSSDDIPRADWESVCERGDNPFVRLPFIRAVERSMRDPGKYWYATFYDADAPVACACFSLFEVDGAIFAPGVLQRLIGGIRRLIPRFFKFRILLCGLPTSTGSSQLAVSPRADWQALVPMLAKIADDLARQERAVLISFKEFDEETAGKLGRLKKLGYRQADSVVTYKLDSQFDSFDEYYQSRSKRARANMRKYIGRFEAAGLRYEHRRGGDGVEQLDTDDVHRLYEAVFERSDIKFEKLPTGFFRELARQCPDDSRFTFLFQNEKVVGFCCALVDGRNYHMLYCGIDYEVNAEADVYFNTLYRALEDGLALHARRVHVGASADEFKRRMGCYGLPLFIYVKGVGAIPSLIFRSVARFVLGGNRD